MSEGLRAEDVKEAVELLGADQALAGRISPAHALCDERAVAVMRAWLAAQSPDYEAAERVVRVFLAAEQPWPVAEGVRAIVDAALVGFHSQPTQTPEVPT